MSTHKMIKLSGEKHNVISAYTVDNVKNQLSSLVK